jgi:predicted nucleic acid-binding protein
VRAVLVDAGPLVALLKRSHNHHEEIVRTLKGIQDPLVSVWPVFVEAMYLLSASWEAQKALWEILETGVVRLLHLDEADVPAGATIVATALAKGNGFTRDGSGYSSGALAQHL